MTSNPSLKVGWAEVDITPEQLPVFIAGQFTARISEGVLDPVTATVLVLDSGGQHVVFVTLDTVTIPDELRDGVRELLNEEGLDRECVIFNATHTHTAPLTRLHTHGSYREWEKIDPRLPLDAVPAREYVQFLVERIAGAVSQAWRNRAPGGMAFGMDYAVVGRNRRWVDSNGAATMYGLKKERVESFDHIDGYEDHSLNLMALYDAEGVLTGLVVNVACPAQETESLFSISADLWHETRLELRKRFGEHLFILPQCSAAGDQTSHLVYETEPHERMLRLRNRTGRQEVAMRIADAAGRVLPYIADTVEYAPVLEHRHAVVSLPLNQMTEADVETAHQKALECREIFEVERDKLLNNPELLKEPRWYATFTNAYSKADWQSDVGKQYEKRKQNPHIPAELHSIRLGDIVFATNPFEFYLDYGVQIKVQSPAIQTFIVQLAGNGTYVPSLRSTRGGGYGSVPASNPLGPSAGRILIDETMQLIRSLWAA